MFAAGALVLVAVETMLTSTDPGRRTRIAQNRFPSRSIPCGPSISKGSECSARTTRSTASRELSLAGLASPDSCLVFFIGARSRSRDFSRPDFTGAESRAPDRSETAPVLLPPIAAEGARFARREPRVFRCLRWKQQAVVRVDLGLERLRGNE